MDAMTFWSAVGAIGTCVAAIVAVLALMGGSSRPKALKLQGRWKGDLGDEWDFVAEVRIEKDQVKGRFHWTLIECPPSLPWSKKIGMNGFELVQGTLDNGVLALSGYDAVAPETDVISLADYTIPLPLSGDAFEGKSCPKKHGKWQEGGVLRGKVSFSRKRLVGR